MTIGPGVVIEDGVCIKRYSSLQLSNMLCIRAGEILGGFWNQTPPLSLTQNVTAYQFLGTLDNVLPRPKSFKAGHVKATIKIYLEALGSS